MKYRVLLFTMLLFTLISCQGDKREYRQVRRLRDPSKPAAWGNNFEVYAFSDDHIWIMAEIPLRQSMERLYFTSENEKYFDLYLGDPENLKQFEMFRNLIFLCDLSSDGKVSTFIKDRLSQEVLKRVNEEAVGFYALNNPWANDQLTLILIGKNKDKLIKLLNLQLNEVFDQFKKKAYHRIEDAVYKFAVRDAREFYNLPFQLKIPKNYLPFKQDAKNNFYSYLARRRESPDRYISFSYKEADNYMQKEDLRNYLVNWGIEIRRKIAWEYYDEDEFSDDDMRIENYTISGYEGVKISGRWQNRKHFVGGAFQSFVFYNSDINKLIIIDNSVFYPQGYKLPALIELEIISNTISFH